MVLTTWQRGREIVTRNRTEEEGPLRDFVDEVRAMDPPVYRARRAPASSSTPTARPPRWRCARTSSTTCVVHACVVIISVETLRVPHVPESERVSVDDLGYRDDGITHLTARFGFQDDIDVPATLRMAADQASRARSTSTTPPTSSRGSRSCRPSAPGMAMWRKKLFVVIARNAANPVAYFGLPDDRTVVMGSHIEL